MKEYWIRTIWIYSIFNWMEVIDFSKIALNPYTVVGIEDGLFRGQSLEFHLLQYWSFFLVSEIAWSSEINSGMLSGIHDSWSSTWWDYSTTMNMLRAERMWWLSSQDSCRLLEGWIERQYWWRKVVSSREKTPAQPWKAFLSHASCSADFSRC